MKWLLVAVNAKYIHSNLGVYSLKTYAELRLRQFQGEGTGSQGPEKADPKIQRFVGKTRMGPAPGGPDLSDVCIEIAEYTINQRTEQILEDIYRRRPDVVGFSCYIWNWTMVQELLHDLPGVLPETDIWLGGPEVSYDGPLLLEREPEVQGVMKGEGEEVFARLLRCYEWLGNSVRKARCKAGLSRQKTGQADEREMPAGCEIRGHEVMGCGIIDHENVDRGIVDHENIDHGNIDHEIAGHESPSAGWKNFWRELSGMKGLTYRDEDGRIRDRQACPVMDLSKLPFPYEDLAGLGNRIIYYESSRGCPFSCSYCLSSIDKTVRFRDLELVKRELDFFLEQRVPQVKFVDRTFNCKKSHAMEIWKHILEHDNGVTNFHFEIEADLLDEEEIQLLGRMRPGLVQLEIGVQSTNPMTLREIRRTMDLDRLRRAVSRIREGHNIHQHLDLIAGLPYEDYESFRRSFNEVYGMEPEQLQLGFLKVLKGSPMQEKTEEYGLVYRRQPPYEVLSTRWLSYGEVCRLKGVEDMVEVYYNSGQFSHGMKLLEPCFADAFSLYESLARYYEEKGWKGLNHSRLARYEILYRFGEGCRGLELADFADALMCDLYLRENSKSRPFFASDQSPYKEQIRRLVPETRTLGTQIHVEVFRSGEIKVFDYRRKDPLTRDAAVRILAEPAAAGTVLCKTGGCLFK